jgi:hypothetical protein
MNALAVQPVSHPTTQDVNMGNDQVGPIVVRDYPTSSPMLLPSDESARLSTNQRRPRRRRRLVADEEEAYSDGLQGDRPLHASVSISSSYHDVPNDPAHMSTPHNTRSESNDII